MKNRIALLMVIILLVGMTGGAWAATKKKTVKPKIVPQPVVAPAVKPAVKPAAKPTAGDKIKLAIEGGAAAGCGVVALEVSRPFNDNLDLEGKLGYGLGNRYSAILAGAGVIWQSNPAFYVGLGLDYVNYSDKVTGIPGISGDVAKGGRIGAGLYVGKNMGKIDIKGGYSTAGGLNLFVKYAF